MNKDRVWSYQQFGISATWKRGCKSHVSSHKIVCLVSLQLVRIHGVYLTILLFFTNRNKLQFGEFNLHREPERSVVHLSVADVGRSWHFYIYWRDTKELLLAATMLNFPIKMGLKCDAAEKIERSRPCLQLKESERKAEKNWCKTNKRKKTTTSICFCNHYNKPLFLVSYVQ